MRLLIDPRKYAVYALPDVGAGRDLAAMTEAFLKLQRLHNDHGLFVDRLLGILRDRRVDGDDGELIADLRHTLPEYIAVILGVAKLIDAMYEDWIARSAEGMNRKAVRR